MNETEVGQAIQMLGFTYASYKITTASGTKQINNIPVGENAGNHLKNVEGVGRNGISGGHNSNVFFESLDKMMKGYVGTNDEIRTVVLQAEQYQKIIKEILSSK
ncbi:hypothetical protein [Pseudolactococcus reticulitermitis]|uniref:Uncharacterized protein n=1 Tax=Pseudolactococcus reticulitermitis TaxID=2025039 RepID=A0A224X758_9LACT|nr:hypothetical protein [Lactococcus reticulitermitis]GAX48366.1 hypothetical protein RsY01_1988 [Lactococcus reticulitermitis]GHU36721.1 hypothetical protein FACS1894192_03950 [Bacilli bacterium]